MPNGLPFDPDALQAWLAGRPRRVIDAPALKPCAVLVPVYLAPEPILVLTRRSARLKNHSGQISFPGGRLEPEDASLLAAALRESEEEVGLGRADVRVLGALDDTVTLGINRITPFLGVIPAGYPFRPDPNEVDYVLEVPLARFLEPARLRAEEMPYPDGRVRTVYFYTVGSDIVWGATARIIKEWLDAMGFDNPGSEA